MNVWTERGVQPLLLLPDAIQDKIHMHDWHATLLHLLGLDHEKLTFKYSGREFRLTDVHGEVIHPILS